MKNPVRVLFVCYGNITRSVMAEFFCNLYGEGKVLAESAGTYWRLLHLENYTLDFQRNLLKDTMRMMQEVGIDVSNQRSRHIQKVDVSSFNVLVNISPVSTRELLEAYSPEFRGKVIDWEIVDPHKKSDRLYRKVRGEIKKKVISLIEEINGRER